VSCPNCSARLFLTRLQELHAAGRLAFFGGQTELREERAFQRLIARLRKKNCRVDGDVAAPIPHRPGRADFPHPVLHERGSLAAA
jgi:hypothetical protein